MVMESARRAADLHCLLAVAVGALAAPELTDLSRSRTDVGGASGRASPMPRQVLAAANPGACWRPRATAPRALLGDGERVLVVGLRAGDAEVAGEVAEDLRHGPEVISIVSAPAGRAAKGSSAW